MPARCTRRARGVRARARCTWCACLVYVACARCAYSCTVRICVCLHGVRVRARGVRARARCTWRARGVRIHAQCAYACACTVYEVCARCAWHAALAVRARAPRPPGPLGGTSQHFGRSRVLPRPSGPMAPDRSRSPARRRRAERQQVVPGDGGPVGPRPASGSGGHAAAAA